jgi:hypothetical protein
MALPIYLAEVLEKKRGTVKVALTLNHPDAAEFGTDPLFAWKILGQFVSPPGDDVDELVLAGTHVKKVTTGALANGTVATQAADHFTIKRGKGRPKVVYTIEVHDPTLLAEVKRGDSAEMAEFVEPGRGASASQAKPARAVKAAAVKPAAVAKKSAAARSAAVAEPAPATATTIDDLLAFARDQVARAGRPDTRAHLDELELRRRLAQPPAKADVARWRSLLAREDAPAKKLALAALEGRWKDLPGLATEALKDTDWDADWDALVPGVLAAWHGNDAAFAALMAKAVSVARNRPDEGLGQALLAACVARGEPHRYVELVLAYPQVVSQDSGLLTAALLRTEAADPALAVKLAGKLLDSKHTDGREINFEHKVHALAVLARHAPQTLMKRVDAGLAAWRKAERSIPVLAAAGRTADVRAAIARGKEDPDWRLIALHTPDRALAIEGLKQRVTDACGRSVMGYARTELVQLVDLGERAWVDRVLEQQLVAIGKRKPGDRDLACRWFTSHAAAVGRADLAFAAVKLPPPAYRRYAADEAAQGAAIVGDFATVLAALALLPGKDPAGAAATAMRTLRTADVASLTGSQVVRPRSAMA